MRGPPAVVVDVPTVIAKAASAAVAEPCVTVILMPEVVPTLAEAGVPLSSPVAALKLAHDGLPVMAKVSAPLRELLALG